MILSKNVENSNIYLYLSKAITTWCRSCCWDCSERLCCNIKVQYLTQTGIWNYLHLNMSLHYYYIITLQYYLMAGRERRLCGTAFFHFFDIYTTLWAVLYECGRTCNIWILQYYVNIHLSHHAHYQPTFVQMVCSDSFAISHNVVGHFQSVLLRFRMLKYVVLGDINKTTTQKEFRFYIFILL